MPQIPEPRAGSVYDFDGGHYRLIARHSADAGIWNAEHVESGARRFIGRAYCLANAPIFLGPETAGELAELNPVVVLDTATGAVTPAPAPDENAESTPRRRARPARVETTCPLCTREYTGSLGIQHRCADVIPYSCLGCQVVVPGAVEARIAPNFPYICAGCVTSGVRCCRVCGESMGATRSWDALICNDCTPLLATNIWERLRGEARGTDVIAETRSHRPYAVEVECFRMPGEAVPGQEIVTPGRHWDKTRDGSITPDAGAAESAEFRSPPFRGDGGLGFLRTEMGLIRKMGYRANKSCGLHVHVDALDMKDEDLAALNKFGMWIQDDMFKLVAPSRNASQYCRKLSSSMTDDRYRWLNLKPSWLKHRTVEFRLHHGTTHPERTSEWVKVCLATVETGLRLGRQSQKPRGDIFTLLGLTKFQREYWTSLAKSLRPGEAVRFPA